MRRVAYLPRTASRPFAVQPVGMGEKAVVEFVKKNTWVLPAAGFAILIVVGILFS